MATINPTAGVNGGTILVNVFPQNLAPGTYTGSLVVDAGAQVGHRTLPISVTITAAAPPPTPVPPTPVPVPPVVVPPAPTVVLSSLVNAARPDLGQFSPGSLVVLKGSNFKGTNVSVTFDGTAGTVVADDGQSITVQMPASLKSGITSQVQVTVDGDKSAMLAVPISELAPAIFAGGVLNEDNSVNGVSNGAPVGGSAADFRYWFVCRGPWSGDGEAARPHADADLCRHGAR